MGEAEIMDFLAEYIRAYICAERRLIEIEVEKSIQGGVCGVRVDRDFYHRLKSVKVDESVPYGEIHEHLGTDTSLCIYF